MSSIYFVPAVFLDEKEQLLQTLWESRKCWVTSIFFFSHYVFCLKQIPPFEQHLMNLSRMLPKDSIGSRRKTFMGMEENAAKCS